MTSASDTPRRPADALMAAASSAGRYTVVFFTFVRYHLWCHISVSQGLLCKYSCELRVGAVATPRTVRTVTDPAVLAALAHPTRRRLMDVLKTTDAATVGILAERLGVAVGSASHHLKVLAQAGLVEEAAEQSTDRREHWWRLVDAAVRWSGTDFDDSPATEAIVAAAASLGLERQVELARRSLTPDPADPYSRVAFSTDAWLRLTPLELDEFGAEIQDVIARFRARAEADAGKDERAQVFVFARGFPAVP